MPFDESSNFFNEGLKLISYCPVCNSRYEQVEAKIVEEKDESYLVHLKCRRCQSSVLALITASALGLTSVGLITDLESYEVVKFREEPAVSADDVLQAHLFLNNNQEAVKKLIS
ncbi:MAG: hypothetical protein V1692_01410 [bacterium]